MGLDVLPRWVDLDTDPSHFKTTGLQDASKSYKIVFSDEFNTPGRDFTNGKDARWTALDEADTVNDPLEYYTPSHATTKEGFLEIKTTNKPASWKGLDGQTGQWTTFTRHYSSAMLQTWNKFCFTGGVLEVAARLPGNGVGPGLWPAAWLMGNLGRATYQASTNGVWPFSIDVCPTDPEWQRLGVDPTSVQGQRISKCEGGGQSQAAGAVGAAGDGLRTRQGRGAPEIDLFEAMTLPGGAGSSFTSSLQIAPPLPAPLRPPLGQAPGAGQWYAGLQVGEGTTVNKNYYGPPGLADAVSFGRGGLDGSFLASSHVWRVEWQPGDLGYIKWFIDGQHVATVPATSLAEVYRGTPPKQVPAEPMSIILNTAMSNNWSPLCGDKVGAAQGTACPPGADLSRGCCSVLNGSNPFQVDYVRVWQDEGDPLHTLGCDPEGFPTRDYIAQHSDLYGPPLLDAPALLPRQARWVRGWLVEGVLWAGAGAVGCVMCAWLLKRVCGDGLSRAGYQELRDGRF